jgi:hypothetical protein
MGARNAGADAGALDSSGITIVNGNWCFIAVAIDEAGGAIPERRITFFANGPRVQKLITWTQKSRSCS